ncbi:hypothetical protein P4O66_017064 [Electrophorus voltai]|uniref:Uncharacterized protein n=1 Tax=Electrophorus voltai TaxID=2609070 RepID=A0AAD9DNU3_9TELE|nr:hypothetical protein P4O66_017064 [Electrophorus voltai]
MCQLLLPKTKAKNAQVNTNRVLVPPKGLRPSDLERWQPVAALHGASRVENWVAPLMDTTEDEVSSPALDGADGFLYTAFPETEVADRISDRRSERAAEEVRQRHPKPDVPPSEKKKTHKPSHTLTHARALAHHSLWNVSRSDLRARYRRGIGSGPAGQRAVHTAEPGCSGRCAHACRSPLKIRVSSGGHLPTSRTEQRVLQQHVREKQRRERAQPSPWSPSSTRSGFSIRETALASVGDPVAPVSGLFACGSRRWLPLPFGKAGVRSRQWAAPGGLWKRSPACARWMRREMSEADLLGSDAGPSSRTPAWDLNVPALPDVASHEQTDGRVDGQTRSPPSGIPALARGEALIGEPLTDTQHRVSHDGVAVSAASLWLRPIYALSGISWALAAETVSRAGSCTDAQTRCSLDGRQR